MTTGEVVFGVIGLVVGFLLGAVTLYYTRRGTVASEPSASATERSAAAAEALVPPVSPSVSWTLTRRKGILYLLRNTGTEKASKVTVTLLPAEAEGFLRYPPPDSIGAG